MSQPPSQELLNQIAHGLRAATRRLYVRRFRFALAWGVRRAIAFLLLCSLLLIVWAVIALPSRLDVLTHWRAAWLSAAAFAGVIVVTLLPWLFRRPRLADVAERVDFAVENHNRVATAVDLLKRGPTSPMEHAAVADGIASLARLDQKLPAESERFLRRRDLARVALTVACVGVAWGLPALATFWQGRASGNGSASVPQSAQVDSSRPGPREQQPAPPTPPPTPMVESVSGVSEAFASAFMVTVAESAQTTGGASAGAGVGNAAASEKLPGADRPPSNGLSTPTTPPKPVPAKQSRGSGLGGAVRGSSNGSVGAGGKGSGGLSLASEKDVRPQDATEREADTDTAGDNAEADENNENRHRGGAQPLLQDRLSSPTRELGIGGLKGSAGSGRGGPTPAKKARGAGSLFLGVPMPDFVPGKLLAGTGKISRQNIKPRRVDDAPPSPSEPAPRAADESPIQRFDVPPDDAGVVLRYLKELHRDDASPEPATQPALTDQQGVMTP